MTKVYLELENQEVEDVINCIDLAIKNKGLMAGNLFFLANKIAKQANNQPSQNKGIDIPFPEPKNTPVDLPLKDKNESNIDLPKI